MFTDAAISAFVAPGYDGTTGSGAKTERLNARVTPQTKAVLERASTLEGRSVTDFVVAKAVEAAVRSIADHELIVLNEQERGAFFTALLSSHKPSTRARNAAKRYKETFQIE